MNQTPELFFLIFFPLLLFGKLHLAYPYFECAYSARLYLIER
jgi:hypothetical protein